MGDDLSDLEGEFMRTLPGTDEYYRDQTRHWLETCDVEVLSECVTEGELDYRKCFIAMKNEIRAQRLQRPISLEEKCPHLLGLN